MKVVTLKLPLTNRGFAQVCILIILMTVFTYFGGDAIINLTLEYRINNLENLTEEIRVLTIEQVLNSSFYPMQKSSSYLIGKVATYTTMQNGTTGKLDWYDTDSSAVINACIWNLTGGGKIFIKTGEYTISNPINIKGGLWIEGENDVELILDANADCNIFQCIDAPTDYLFFTLTDITLHGNKAQNTLGSGIYINVTFHDVFIERCAIWYFAEYGIYMEDAWHNRIEHCCIESCDIDGVYLEAGAESSIFECNISSNGRRSITVNSSRTSIVGTTILNNQEDGIYVLTSINVMSCSIRNNGQKTSDTYSGIVLTGDNSRIIGNYFNGSSDEQSGVNLKFSVCDNNTIIGNQFLGHLSNAINYQSGNIIRYNIGFVTENSGTQTCADQEWITHGLAGTPTMVQITAGNCTYDSVAIIANYVHSSMNSTHLQANIYWANSTAIDDDVILISWYVEYMP